MSHPTNGFIYLRFIFENNLPPTIFEIPPGVKGISEDFDLQKQRFNKSYAICSWVDKNKQVLTKFYERTTGQLLGKGEFALLMNLSCVLRPFLEFTIPTKKKKDEYLIEFIVKESLKLSNKDASNTFQTCIGSQQFAELVKSFSEPSAQIKLRKFRLKLKRDNLLYSSLCNSGRWQSVGNLLCSCNG